VQRIPLAKISETISEQFRSSFVLGWSTRVQKLPPVVVIEAIVDQCHLVAIGTT